jgi:hypothetical protein
MKKAHLVCSLILMLAAINTTAQLDTRNSSVVYISTATDTFFVAGSFTNATGSAFTNNGIFQVKRDLINDQAAMATGTGTLYLNGTSAQTVSGSQTFKTNNLVSGNAAGILLNNNLSVSGLHSYSAGMLTTSATPNYMIYEAGSSYTGSSDSRHVNGWVKKIGTTDFIFPVGNATYERSVALTNLTAASEFNVKYNPSPTPNHMSVYNPLVLVDTFEYWTINKISGAAARVTMNWNTAKVSFPNFQLSGIRAAYFDGTFWRHIGGAASGTVATSGSVTSNSVTAFNTNFVIGSVAWLLPINIISFNAQPVNDHAKINWVIGNELNVDHYELERSDDGISFYKVAAQLPFNRNSTEFYSYEDQKVFKNIVYYRLKITDRISQVSYSSIINLSGSNNAKELYVVTNPVDASIEIYAGNAVKGIYNYTITNAAGQTMQAGTIDLPYSGIHSIKLKPIFTAGTYFLLLRNEKNSLQKTIIKK